MKGCARVLLFLLGTWLVLVACHRTFTLGCFPPEGDDGCCGRNALARRNSSARPELTAELEGVVEMDTESRSITQYILITTEEIELADGMSSAVVDAR